VALFCSFRLLAMIAYLYVLTCVPVVCFLEWSALALFMWLCFLSFVYLAEFVCFVLPSFVLLALCA